MLPLWISVAVFASAVLSIYGDKPQNRTLHYICKPLTMMILIGSLLILGDFSSSFGYLMLTGLICSLVGDVFLMLPRDRFIAGLVSFLIAHLAYIAAFSLHYDGQLTWWWLLSLVVFATLYFAVLVSGLGKMKAPVFVYISVIMAMLWLAGEIYWAGRGEVATLLFAGAITFAVSDASLAWNKFKIKYNGAQAVILSTYFLAQWLLCQAAIG